jgi:sacsin
LEDALENLHYDFDLSFQVQIEHRSAQESRRTGFVVHHSIRGGSMDNSLRAWAKDQKLVPWVAVAAQLPVGSSPLIFLVSLSLIIVSIQCLEAMQGSLFTVLPLPILIRQPVHIHGLFSISPDRARLYQLSNSSSQDQAPARWNSWLFHSSVPIAWTRLLSYLADLYPDTPTFEWWPQNLEDPHDLLADAIENIVKIIDTKSLSLFPTAVGYVNKNAGLLDTGKESMALIDALQEAQVPIVYIPQRLRDKVEHLFNGRVLSPPKLCAFLKKDSNRIKGWTDVTKQVILEYLLSESGFTEYGTLELFPFEDGKYRSIEGHTAFVHRDSFERELFALEQSRNIDLDKVSAPTRDALVKGCKNWNGHPSIQYRSVGDLRDYCLYTVFNKIQADQDSVLLDIVTVAFVSKVWTWIIKRRISILDGISDLWLIPLTNGYNRKIIPQNPSSEAIFAPVGEKGDLLRKFDARCCSETPLLLDTGPRGLCPESLQMIIEASRRNPDMLIKDGGNMVHLASWLSQISAVVESGSDEEKEVVLKVIASNLPLLLPRLNREAIANSLSSLGIFRRVYWKVEGANMYVGYNSLHKF